MIRVSDISVYLKCPRKCYFIAKGYELTKEIRPSYIQHFILKELALSYESAFHNEDKLSFLNNELNRISEEIRFIYRSELSEIDDEILTNSVAEIRSYLENICSNLSKNNFYSFESIEVEPLLRSEKFGFSGSPNRLIKINNKVIPSIIKTGSMPEKGVWKGDRLQLTAYAFLVEETYENVVELGFVEYARWGYVREVKLKRYERRKVLQIRDKIEKIQKGFMPEKPKDAPCMYCGFNEMCETTSSLASRFFLRDIKN